MTTEEQIPAGTAGRFLYKAGGWRVIPARALGYDGAALKIEFRHPGQTYMHEVMLRTPAERARFTIDPTYEFDIPAERIHAKRPGRPRTRVGDYERVGIEMRRDHIDWLDAQAARERISRRDVLERILHTAQLETCESALIEAATRREGTEAYPRRRR